MKRDDVAKLVKAKLIANGSEPYLARMIVRPGFFTNGDRGLETIARALGVIGVDDAIDET